MSVARRQRQAAAPSSGGKRSLPDRELCVRMFETMVLMRATEDRLVNMYRQGQLLGSLYTGHGHEAIAVGTAAALRADDVLAPLHRDLGAHMWRGFEPWEVMACFLGKATSPNRGRDTTLHYGRLDLNILNPVSQIPDNYPVATGAAFAAKYRGKDSVALAYCGDGSTSRGDWHEALNIAAVMKLPCVFVVENNQFAYSTPLSLQMATSDVASKAAAYGMPGVRVDGNDVIAVYEATRSAAQLARHGDGPTLIEALTMRMHGHAEHDAAEYVPRELLEEWAKRDPIGAFEGVLRRAGIVDDDDVSRIKKEARDRVLADMKKVREMPMPDPATVEEGVYAE